MKTPRVIISWALQGSAPGTSPCPVPRSRDFVLSNAITPTPMRQLLKITSIFALALVFTAGTAFGQDDNDADVDATGNNNTATIQQTGQGGTATIEQIGDNNTADGFFFGVEDKGVNNTSNLTQIGNNNQVWTRFGDPTRGNEINVDQGESGSESFQSFATVVFKGPGSSQAKNNDVDVGQFGRSQTATIQVRGGIGNDIDVLQENRGNEVDRLGSGNGSNGVELVESNNNIVDITQEGTFGSAYTAIDGGGQNTVDIMQNANSQNAEVNINNGFGNTVDIAQGTVTLP